MGRTWFARLWKMILGGDGVDDLVSCLPGVDRVDVCLHGDGDPVEEMSHGCKDPVWLSVRCGGLLGAQLASVRGRPLRRLDGLYLL